MRRITMALSVLILVASVYSWAEVGAACADKSVPPWQNARVDSIDQDRQTVSLTDCPQRKISDACRVVCDGPSLTLAVGAALLSEIKSLSKGDHVMATFDAETKNPVPETKEASTSITPPAKKKTATGMVSNKTADTTGSDATHPAQNQPKSQLPQLKAIRVRSTDTTASERFWTFFLTLAGLFLIITIVTGGRPFRLIIGEDGKYSNSKTQMAIWFWIVISTYLAAVYLRLSAAGWDFFGNINIPTNLLLISGMSALTFGGAKAITTQKTQDNPAAKPQQDPSKASLVTDLTRNDAGQFDLGDVQMLVVTLVAVAMYVTSVLHFLNTIQFLKTVNLPDVDTTILAAFGLGHGAYLTKKAVGEVGKS